MKNLEINILHELSDKVPSLFHYTSPQGLQGMMNGKLWFTHIKYLNDSQEYELAYKLISESIERLYKFKPDLYTLPDVGEFVPFTFSLTEKEDDLSQFRGYGSGGYCFEIYRGQLDQAIKSQKLLLAKCIYIDEDDNIDQFVQKEIVGVPPDYYLNDEKFHVTKGYSYIPVTIRTNFLKYAPFFKHAAFKDEAEWRIVKSLPYNEMNLVKLRSGKNNLIPYLDIDLKNESSQKLIINKLIVGPTPNMDLALDACKYLLKENAADHAIASKIPYRNW